MRDLNRHKTLAVLLVSLAGAACGEFSANPAAAVPAVGLWTQPAGAIPIIGPADLRAGDPSVVWVADRIHKAVLRFDSSVGEFQMFGYLDAEPAQLVEPLRIAVADDLGVFVYDRGTEMLDLYTPGGQHVRGFRPGFEPLALHLTRRPFGLVYVVVAASADSSLALVWTDLEGAARDTLVGPRSGPEPLRNLRFRPGGAFVGRSGAGAWVWSAAIPDTVFEVAPRRSGRRLALGGAGETLQGLFGEPEEDILWLLRYDGRTVHYAAFDVAGQGALPGDDRLLGTRTTPPGFAPQEVIGGAVIGWTRTDDRASPYVTAAYDLRVGDLRRPRSSGRRTP